MTLGELMAAVSIKGMSPSWVKLYQKDARIWLARHFPQEYYIRGHVHTQQTYTAHHGHYTDMRDDEESSTSDDEVIDNGSSSSSMSSDG